MGPMGWDGMGCKNFSSYETKRVLKFSVLSHPIARFSKKLRPMRPMGWNCPIPRGAL